MSGSVQLNGVRVTKASVTIPMYGVWTADVDIATADVIGASVTLAIGGLTIVGTIVRQGLFSGTRHLRIVGGAGGWRKTIPARGYSLPFGVRASAVIGDAARECGETVTIGSDSSVGSFYTRDRGKAKRVLTLLAGNVWYVDNGGVTQVRDRDTSAIASPFTVEKWHGGLGTFVVATESYQDWTPGRTFSTNTVPEPQTISSVTIDADNDGKVRLTVTAADSYRERLLSDFRAIVRDEVASSSYAAVYEYVIAPSPLAPGVSYTIDANPTDSRMPPLTRVPLATELGNVVPSATGTKCRIRFVNADPSRPEVCSLNSTTEHLMTTEATALLIYNTLVALMAAAGGGPLVAAVLQPLLGAAVTTALTAQAVSPLPGTVAQNAAALLLQPGFATGVVPSRAIFAAWSVPIAALGTKVPDVTGLFPGVGIPSGS